MKVKTIKAIEIDGLGLFRCVDEWETFSKWQSVEDSKAHFICTDTKTTNVLDRLIGINVGDDELNIVTATSYLADKIREKDREESKSSKAG